MVNCHQACPQECLVSISTVADIQLIQLLAGLLSSSGFSPCRDWDAILSSVLLQDLPVVQGCLAGAALILAVNFLLDSVYPYRPRIRGGIMKNLA